MNLQENLNEENQVEIQPEMNDSNEQPSVGSGDSSKPSKSKRKFKFKLPTAFLIILVIMGFIAFLSWFTKGDFQAMDSNGEWNGLYYSEAKKIGFLAAWFIYPIKGFLDATDLIIFLFAIGAFIGIMMETESMEAGMVSLIKKLNGKEIWAIIPLMMLFSFGGTTYGMAEETIAFYPLLVPLFILAGFDPLVGFMTLSIGAGSGVAASTVNPFAIGAASGTGGINMGEGAAARWIFWVVVTTLAISFVMWYAIRTKKNPSKTGLNAQEIALLNANAKDTFSLDDAPKFTIRKKIGLITFGVFFIVMVLSVMPWEAFGESAYDEWDGPITFFYDMGSWLNDNLFFIFGGTMDNAFYIGGMYFAELAAFFLLGFIIIALMFKKGDKGTVESFVVGAKDMFSVALIIAVSRGLSILLGDSGFTMAILNGLGSSMASMGKVGFIIVIFLLMILLSFLIPSTSGLASASFGIVGPLAMAVGQTPTEGVAIAALAVTAFSLASGIVNLFTPTSGIVMGALETSKISYGSYVKTVAPYIGALTVTSFLLVTFAALAI